MLVNISKQRGLPEGSEIVGLTDQQTGMHAVTLSEISLQYKPIFVLIGIIYTKLSPKQHYWTLRQLFRGQREYIFSLLGFVRQIMFSFFSIQVL